MESVVARQVALALESRRDGRGGIDELQSSWERLAEAVETMAEQADQVRVAVNRLPQTNPEHSAAVRAAERLLADDLPVMRRELRAAAERVASVRRRIGRDTVNIGVIGSSKAGKSTLLRAITDLPESVIPSSKDNPTTASRSRIHHEPGPGRAVLNLRTWASFREQYLVPLHAVAGLPEAPSTPEAFRAYRYPTQNEVTGASGGKGVTNVTAVPYLNKLYQAQSSLASYLPLLQSGTETLVEPLGKLRPYVAYPRDETDTNRPYHAVQDIFVHCSFPEVDVVGLGLVDLPGAGEAGLDVDRQFLSDLRDDVDLLLQVKKPDTNSAFFTAADHATLNLAESARGDVPLRDFVVAVLNRDERLDPDLWANAVDKTETATRVHGVQVLLCNASNAGKVRSDLLPAVLTLLGERLAGMDAAAVAGARARARQAAHRANSLGDSLLDAFGALHGMVPGGQLQFRGPAMALRLDLAGDLAKVVDDYDARLKRGEGSPETITAVATAVAEARDWIKKGFGRGSLQTWLAEQHNPSIAFPERQREQQFAIARAELARVFAKVDGSLDASVGNMWDAVTTALRGRLKDAAVPPCTPENAGEALRELLGHLSRGDQPTLHRAVSDLVDIRANYGSVFLRVCQPIIAQVRISHADGGLRNAAAAMHAVAGLVEEPAPAVAETPWWQQVDSPANHRGPRSRPWSTAATSAAAPGSAPGPSTPAASASSPALANGVADTADRRARELAEELDGLLTEVVGLLEQALRQEAVAMTAVLDAAVNHFQDRATLTPGVENEYETLPDPIRRRIWPELFDGPGPAAAAALARAEEAVHAARAAAGRGTRRPSPQPDEHDRPVAHAGQVCARDAEPADGVQRRRAAGDGDQVHGRPA